MERIWIERDWFIPVDAEGYVAGPCFEGMLGCVLQLQGESGDKAALKIPRLLADTVEENAYIYKLMENEEKAVIQIRAAGGKTAYLLDAQFLARDPLKLRRSTEYSRHDEAKEQNGHAVFVYFERDEKPRFFSVDESGDSFSVFPAQCKEYFSENIAKKDWQSLKDESQPSFAETVYHYRDVGGGTANGKLSDALGTQRIASIWYAAVPSLVFDWAEGNLQEAITKQEIKEWSLDQHFTLFENILTAVGFLHKNSLIHGDIRPANVMRIGPQEPGNYRLGDYGSYGKEWQVITGQSQPTGFTKVGPAIGRLRDTPFYAQERRSGTQFESANLAIVRRIPLSKPPGGYNFLILIGWRSDLLSADGSVKREIEQEFKELIEKRPSETRGPYASASKDELTKGDRLRLRNYLFEIIHALKPDKDRRYYLCTSRYAEIVHDHLVVYPETGEIKDSTVIDLSNYVEFRQWSAATDLYGVGALCLYCLFSRGLQKPPPSSAPIVNDQPESMLNPAPQSAPVTNGDNLLRSLPGSNPVDSKNPDMLFVDMMDILQSDPYFKFFWKELERFRKEIETLYDLKPRPTSYDAANKSVLAKESPGGQRLYDMALYTTNNILQSTPKARVILEQFEMNLAHFLLFMHFVLACLHRQSHMPPQSKELLRPFATDRTEQPKEGGAASQALKRLSRIRAFLVQPFFDDFRCEENEVLDFNPRSDFQMRIELEKLKREVRDLSKISVLRSVLKPLELRSSLKELVNRIEREGESEQKPDPSHMS